GIANQLLAVIALAVVTSWIVNAGRGRYAPLLIAPMLFVIASTMTAGYRMITGQFMNLVTDGWRQNDPAKWIKGGINIALTVFIIAAVATILFQAMTRWINYSRAAKPAQSRRDEGV